MSLLGRIIFTILVSRLAVFLVQGLPPVREMKEPKYFAELFHCDLCLGVYANFFFLAFFQAQITTELTGIYVPLLSEFVTAMFFSFITHLIMLGAKLRWGVFE